jgi:hypothetical protein
MIVFAQQNGIGPIVSLSMGDDSAPASIADAPELTSLLPTDTVLVNRGGQLQQVRAAAVSNGMTLLVGTTPVLAVAPLESALALTDVVLIWSGGTLAAITWASLLAQIAAAIGTGGGTSFSPSNNTLLLLL